MHQVSQAKESANPSRARQPCSTGKRSIGSHTQKCSPTATCRPSAPQKVRGSAFLYMPLPACCSSPDPAVDSILVAVGCADSVIGIECADATVVVIAAILFACIVDDADAIGTTASAAAGLAITAR